MSNPIELVWQEKNLSSEIAGSNNATIFSSQVNSDEIEVIHAAVKQTVDKAVLLLEDNVQDDSRYFLCEWQPQNATLKIVFSDDNKTKDANCSVECVLTNFAVNNEFTDELKHWIQNYLTTHTGFLQYSLIAIFHASTRDKSYLL